MVLTSALVLKAAPIVLRFLPAFFKGILPAEYGLVKELLVKGVDLTTDQLIKRIETSLEEKPDILAQISSAPLHTFIGTVMGALISRFAEEKTEGEEQKQLLKLADEAPAGWVKFIEFGSTEITLEDWRDFLLSAEQLPDLRHVPFICFFNWHIRISPSLRQRLADYLADELPDNLPKALLTAYPAAERAYKQVNLEKLNSIDEKTDLIVATSAYTAAKAAGQPYAPEWNLPTYANSLQQHCLGIPLTHKFGSDGLDRITLRHVFVPPSVRQLNTDRLADLDLPKEDIETIIRGEIDHLPKEKRQHAERYLKHYREQPRQPALDVLFSPGTRGHILLGDAGVGKTSLVRHLVLDWVEAYSKKDPTTPTLPLPLYIELKSYAETAKLSLTKKLLDYLHEGILAPCALPRDECANWLLSGHAYFILDGLDEVAQPTMRSAIAQQARDWVDKGVRVLFTSRIAGFEERNWPADASWQRWQLLEFDVSQRDLFLSKAAPLLWPDATLAAQRLADLRRRFQAFPHIEQLSRNPLLLTLIALMQRNGRLGESRVAIYTEASSWLLDRWEQRLNIQENLILPEATKRRIVRRLALRIYEEKLANRLGENLFPLSLLQEVIRQAVDPIGANPARADALAESLPRLLHERHSLLCWVGGNHYAFLHRSFLEFFAAEAWKEEEDKLHLTPEEVRHQLLYTPEEENTPRWCHPRYQNLIPLYLGLLDVRPTKQMLDQLWTLQDGKEKNEALLFIATCFAEIQDRSPHAEFQVRLIKALEKLATSPWSEKGTKREQNQANRNLRECAIRTHAALAGSTEAERCWLRQVMGNRNLHSLPRRVAVDQLASLFGSDETLCQRLQALMVDRQEDEWVRRQAIETLGQEWGPVEWLRVPLLALMADRQENEWVRTRAIETLGQEWGQVEWLRVPLLALMADRQQDESVRDTARSVLGRLWLQDAEVLAAIRKSWR